MSDTKQPPVPETDNIGLWLKESGNIMNHSKGLTPGQVKFLQSLKAGDRVMLWANNPKPEETKPHYSFKKYTPKNEDF